MMPVLICVMLALSYLASQVMFPARLCDFRAFYCSGRMILAGRDPYREHPLHECEHALPEQFATDLPPDVTIPAPYPGYVLALFALMASLPFNVAAIAWTLCSYAALYASIVRIAALTHLARPAVAIVLALPAAVIAIPVGQPTLFVLLALAVCATAITARQHKRAAIAALVVFVDPHVGLALALSLAIAVPQTRLVLGAGIATFAAIDFFTAGAAREYEYLFNVLPAHALVNVPEFSQFSVSNLLFTVGLAPQAAVTAGHVWFALALVSGAIVGLRLRERLGAAAMVFVPVAFAVFGGVHTHLQQLDLALPAFLLVLSGVAPVTQRAVGVLTFIAAVPWLICAESPPQYLTVAASAYVFARVMRLHRLSLPLSLTSVLLLSGIAVAIVSSLGTPAETRSPHTLAQFAGVNPLAEVAWGNYVRATSTPEKTWYMLAKLPTLLAFAAILVFMCKCAFASVSTAGAARLASDMQ